MSMLAMRSVPLRVVFVWIARARVRVGIVWRRLLWRAFSMGDQRMLASAVQSGDVAAVRLALSSGAHPDGDGGNDPLLICAISKQHYEVAVALMEAGASVNLGDFSDGVRPLHLACQYGWLEGINALIARGAEVEGQSWDGQRPIDLALINKPNREETLELMLGHGADINGYNGVGRTLLHVALEYLDEEQASKMASWLVARNADVRLRTQDEENETPLEIARSRTDWTPSHNVNWLEGAEQGQQAKLAIGDVLRRVRMAQPAV